MIGPFDRKEPKPATLSFRARGRTRHIPGAMNKTEAEYALMLEARKRAGEIHDWKFEAMKFRLAKSTFYTSDFLVIAADGAVECHEVKGHMEDDAAVKIKVVATQYPYFRFLLIRKERGVGWTSTEIRP